MDISDITFEPTRAAALDRLASFVPSAGYDYAAGRNTDLGPSAPSAVSRLSPYLRYRILTEHEVVAAVLDKHGMAASEKFIQEVLWRTYWKGWLEMRPSVWTCFVAECEMQRREFSDAAALAAAESGMTGIEGFDDWARELVATGYLHNHARMWFASIWIFTLRLPWALGADFFLRNLLDADAASNTLSWRWVAGLQTVGKTYLATTENIARYTNGRFAPTGLATTAPASTELQPVLAQHLIEPRPPSGGVRSLLLVTAEDMHPESVVQRDIPIVAAIIATDHALLWGDSARSLIAAAAVDVAARTSAYFGCPAHIIETLNAEPVIAAAHRAGARQVVTPYAPVGPVSEALARLGPQLAEQGISLARIRRPWDGSFWPHAKRGFFPFKERIGNLLDKLGVRSPA